MKLDGWIEGIKSALGDWVDPANSIVAFEASSEVS